MDSILYYGFEGYNYAGYVYPDDEINGVFDTIFPCWFYEKNVPNRNWGTPVGYWYDGPKYGDPYKLVLFYFNYQYLVDSVIYDNTGNIVNYVFDRWRVNELTKRILDFFNMPVLIQEKPKLNPSRFNISVYPKNFIKDILTLRYTLPKNGKFEVLIIDKTGRKVKEVIKNYKHPGAYGIDIDIKTLPSGVYFLNIRYQNEKFTKKIIKIK